MLSFESTNPYTPEFQPAIRYSGGDLSPKVVASTTADIFGLCLDNGIPHGEESLDFLLKQTKPFVDKIKLGIERYPLRVEYANSRPVEEFVLLTQGNETPTIPYDESREALDFALLIMGTMPERARSMFGVIPGTDSAIGFSRRGMFRVPNGVVETKQRVHELGVQVIRGILRDTTGSSDFINFPDQARARLFFHLAKEIELVNPDEQKKDAKKNFPDILAAKHASEG